jgi:hypothetical protein
MRVEFRLLEFLYAFDLETELKSNQLALFSANDYRQLSARFG